MALYRNVAFYGPFNHPTTAMPIDTELRYAKIENLKLDPKNPRLGVEKVSRGLDQDQLLNEMRDWELEELAVSFLEDGYWPQEALLVIEEKLDGEKSLVVIEGNRRLAALKYLQQTLQGNPPTPKWQQLVNGQKPLKDLFQKIPYLIAGNRNEVSGYLGFRHVSGIKEWGPAEKAAFIAKMIDEDGLTYNQVMRRIGSKTEPVRRNYISYRIFLQMKEVGNEIDVNKVEQRFSLLFLALRGKGTQEYLGVDIDAEPGTSKAERPVPPKKRQSLVFFARWLFGSEFKSNPVEPIVSDSRQIGNFDKAIGNEASRGYLERTSAPDLKVAYRIAGGEEWETYEELETASDHLRSVLGVIHNFRKSRRIHEAVEKVSRAALELLRGYPEMRANLLEEDEELTKPIRSRR